MSKSQPIEISSGEDDVGDEVIFVKEVNTRDNVQQQTCSLSKFKIDRRKLKELRAKITIELSPSPKKCLDVNNLHNEQDTLPITSSPSPKPKSLEDTFNKMSLSPPAKTACHFIRTCRETEDFTKTSSSPKKICSVKSTPQKNQSTFTLISSSPAAARNPTKTKIKMESSLQTTSMVPAKVSCPKPAPHKRQLTRSPLPSAKTPSPRTTPVKMQLSLDDWVTPNKRLKETPLTPSCDVNAKRNEVVWPPIHVTLDIPMFIKSLYKNLQEFPTSFTYLIESIQDAELHSNVVSTIASLMSSDCAPTSEMIWYLVTDILTRSSDAWLVSATYSLLSDILNRYPSKCIAMKITWKDIAKYFFVDKDNCDMKTSNGKLALTFLLAVISVELKATALKSKKRLTKHFAADIDIRHVKEIIPCVKECLINHTFTSTTCGTADGLPQTGICGLQLLQSFLKLFMIVSSNKQNAAIRLADELMYLYITLPSLEQRVLLLTSLESHIVRSHLINILLMNYCSLLPQALQSCDHPLSIRKIFLQDFYREPPKRDEELKHSVDDVEEYVSLVAYLLQSYIISHTLHGYHNDQALCGCDVISELSQEDLNYLEDGKFYIASFRERCKAFQEEQSARTELLLNIMEYLI